MAVSTALFALGAGLSTLGGVASTIGNRMDLITAPDQRRFQGNIFGTALTNSLSIVHTLCKSPDFARVAETLEKTGYRVDETIHCYREWLPRFITDLKNRRYWLPIQMTATFEGLTAPLSGNEKDDIAMRFSNGIRFHFNLNENIGQDLAYDNVEE